MILTVYTAITAGFPDDLRDPIGPPDPQGRTVRYVCFTNRPESSFSCRRYEMRSFPFSVSFPRRLARRCKLLAHEMFPDTGYSLWHDASHQLVVDPWSLVDHYLQDGNHFAAFRHGERKTLAEELAACIRLHKDVPKIMESQVRRYMEDGYYDTGGLMETSAVLRSHAPATRRFNESWWYELCSGSVRDQLSVNYCLWKTGLPFTYLAGHRSRSPYFSFTPHR